MKMGLETLAKQTISVLPENIDLLKSKMDVNKFPALPLPSCVQDYANAYAQLELYADWSEEKDGIKKEQREVYNRNKEVINSLEKRITILEEEYTQKQDDELQRKLEYMRSFKDKSINLARKLVAVEKESRDELAKEEKRYNSKLKKINAKEKLDKKWLYEDTAVGEKFLSRLLEILPSAVAYFASKEVINDTTMNLILAAISLVPSIYLVERFMDKLKSKKLEEINKMYERLFESADKEHISIVNNINERYKMEKRRKYLRTDKEMLAIAYNLFPSAIELILVQKS